MVRLPFVGVTSLIRDRDTVQQTKRLSIDHRPLRLAGKLQRFFEVSEAKTIQYRVERLDSVYRALHRFHRRQLFVADPGRELQRGGIR